MTEKDLRDFLDQPGRFGILSTADGNGEVNGAVFGSARLTDEGTLVLALGENRSLRYLRANPRAVLTVFDPAPHPLAWKGARIYLEAARIEGDGPLFDGMREEVRRAAGEGAARRIKAAVAFRIGRVRPLIDISL